MGGSRNPCSARRCPKAMRRRRALVAPAAGIDFGSPRRSRPLRQRRGVVDFHCSVWPTGCQAVAVEAKGDAVAPSALSFEREQFNAGLCIPYFYFSVAVPSGGQAFAVRAIRDRALAAVER